jgi:hypothetical protein
VIPQNPTPEQKKRAKDIQNGVWCEYPEKKDPPGAAGKAEAERRYGKRK